LWLGPFSCSSSVELSSTLGQMRLFQAPRRCGLRAGGLVKPGHFVRNWKRRLFSGHYF
jgi:hypothetical protein